MITTFFKRFSWVRVKDITQVFWWLLWRDIALMKTDVLSRTVDVFFWAASSIVVSAFILPALGITKAFGVLIWVGSVVTMALFNSVDDAQEIIADIAGRNHIGYLLTLPLPSWLVLVKMAVAIALNNMALTIGLLPMGKLLLWSQIDLSHFSLGKFILIFIVMNLFFGFFALWIASWAKNSLRIAEVRRRLVNPLWLFGGYQFTWLVLYSVFPRFALLMLLNPMTYTFEGLRAALLGAQGFIPFWFSLGALVLFTIIFAWWSLRWMKQRLDYVG